MAFDSNTGLISFLALERHLATREEVNISNIPFNVHLIHTIPGRHFPADVTMTSLRHRNTVEDNFVLTDYTMLDMERFRGRLHIYKDSERWVLESTDFIEPSLFVKRSGENEFTRYRTITFMPNWGDFIEGEVFVEAPDLSEFIATHMTTMNLRLIRTLEGARSTTGTVVANSKVQVLETRIRSHWVGGVPIIYARLLSEDGLYGWGRLDNICYIVLCPFYSKLKYLSTVHRPPLARLSPHSTSTVCHSPQYIDKNYNIFTS